MATHDELNRVAGQLRLDALAVESCRVLAAQGLPHVLLKGPSTARWLYDPPRSYRDVDLLVPIDRLDEAVAVLTERNVVRPTHSRFGEESPQSVVLVGTVGGELDLHVALPTMEPTQASFARTWGVLSSHVVSEDLDGHQIPMLDYAGRCLVLALHAVASVASPQTREDLRLARQHAAADDWLSAASMAEHLGVTNEFEVGLTLVDEQSPAAVLSPKLRLILSGAPAPALGLERLTRAPWSQRPGLLWREAFPSKAFMRRVDPRLRDHRIGLYERACRVWPA